MPIPEFDPSQPFETEAQASAPVRAYVQPLRGQHAVPEFDPSQPFEKIEAPGMGDKALNAVGMVGKAIDAYGGDASTRAAIHAAQTGKPVIQAFTDQYGNSEGAPSGKDIALEAGIKDEPVPEGVQAVARTFRDKTIPGMAYKALVPQGIQKMVENASQADLAGLGVETAASPLNLLAAGKPIVQGLAKGAESLGDMIKASYLGRKSGQALDAVGRGGAYLASGVTGVPAKDIRTYATQKPAIDQMMKEAGGSIVEAADASREKFQTSLGNTRKGANAVIADAIRGSSKKKTVPLQPILQELSTVRRQLNSKLDIEEIAQIDKMVERVKGLAKQGKVSPQGVADITSYLQKQGKPSYGSGGIFALGDDAQRAAKSGAAKSRQIRNQKIPGIELPFETLQDLRKVEKETHKNLLLPGKPEGALLAAGSGVNERNAKALEALDDLAPGGEFADEAARLSAARYFHNPSLLPVDSTGKSGTRLAVGAGLGELGGHFLGAPPMLGAKVGAALTSPAVLKTAIDLGRGAAATPRALGSLAQKITPEQFRDAFLAVRGSQLQNQSKKAEKKLSDDEQAQAVIDYLSRRSKK